MQLFRERLYYVTGRLVRHYHQTQPVSRPSWLIARGFVLRPQGGAARMLSLLYMAASLAGFAVSMPIGTFSNANDNASDDATGAIPSSALERLLDAEDWRRARAALSTALDPQGNGSLVGWENPQSGAKGSFAPVGKAYPQDAKICRAFKTEVARKAGAETMQGVACADKGGDWTIAEISGPKKG